MFCSNLTLLGDCMKSNVVYRENGYLLLPKECLSFDILAEWFIRHLNDNVYIIESEQIVGVIRCKDFENNLRDGKELPTIRHDFACVNSKETKNRLNIYKQFDDDITLFRLPVIDDGIIKGEYYNSLSYKENTERYHIKNIIPELKAFRHEIRDYFSKRKCGNIAVIIDENDWYAEKVLSQILGDLCFFCHNYNDIEKIRKKACLDAILDLKYPDEYRNYYIGKKQITESVLIIFEIMSDILTRLFVEYCRRFEINIVAVYAIGKEDISGFGPADESIMSKNKTLIDTLSDEAYLKKFYRSNRECFRYATDKKFGQLGGRVVRFNGLYNHLVDVESEYINVNRGIRRTCDEPEVYINDIHVFGPCIAQGICVTDAYTIESYLQRLINEKMPKRFRVVNHGSATHTPYASYCNDFFNAMDTEFCEGDIVLILDAFTEHGFKILKKNRIPIICDLHLFDGFENLFLNSTYHCNHIANSMYANLIYQELIKRGIISIDNDCCNKAKKTIKSYYEVNNVNLEFRDDALLHNKELLEYRDSLIKLRIPRYDSKKIGAICTQANPFTKGHKALVEYASRIMDYVYVFVAQDSLSSIQFLERIDIVKDTVKEYRNVMVLSSGSYLSSYRTFPDYFSVAKKNSGFDLRNVWAETKIFAEIYCPALGINYRILGEEPNDRYTHELVKHLEETLPHYGINVLIIPRVLSDNNEIISASRVRSILSEGNDEGLEHFITPYAISVLKRYYNEYIAKDQ